MQPETLLIQAGLSEEQATIYQALLDKGPQKAGALAHWSGIKRGMVYKSLEQLEAKALVAKKGGNGSVAVYTPSHPSRLLDMLELQEKELVLAKESVAANLGTFLSQFNLQNNKPTVQFFEGLAGVKKTLDDSLHARGPIYTYVDVEAVVTSFKDINEQYVKRREAANIPKKILVADTPTARNYFKEHGNQLTDIRFIGKTKPPFGSAMQIYDDKISYITIGVDQKTLIGVLIEDIHIATMHKYFFECLYDLSQQKPSV